MEGSHRGELLEHLGEQLLEVPLCLLMRRWKLLHTGGRIEDWTEEVDNVYLLFTILIEALK